MCHVILTLYNVIFEVDVTRLAIKASDVQKKGIVYHFSEISLVRIHD